MKGNESAESRLPVRARRMRPDPDLVVTSPAPSRTAASAAFSLPQLLWRQRWLILVLAGVGLCVGAIMLQRAVPRYGANSDLYIQQSGPRIINDVSTSNNSQYYLFTQCELIRSTAILAAALEVPGVAEAKAFKGVDNPVGMLKAIVRATPGKQVDLIRVSTETDEPGDAAVIANAVVQAYIAYQAKAQKSTAGEVLKILQKEKDRYETELKSLSGTMLAYKKANPVLALETATGNIVLERLTTLTTSVTQAELRLIDLRVLNEQAATLGDDLTKIRAFVAAEQTKLAGIPGVDAAGRWDVKRAERESAIVQEQFGQNHPSVAAAQRNLAFIKEDLALADKEAASVFREVLKQELAGAERRAAELRRADAAERTAAFDVSVKSAEYGQMVSAQARAERMLDVLDSRMKEVRVTEDGGNLNIAILESAKPNTTPVSPVKSKMLGMGMLGGLLAGVALALLRELFDERFRSVDEIVQMLDLQVLGTIPHILGKRSQPERGQEIHLRPKSDVAEAFRTLRTAVHFGLPDEGGKTVLMTSPAPGDGKSTTTANLAIATAQAGRRVLLIDADCRKPTQHKIFKLSAEVGLSTVLLGRTPLKDAIQRTSIENLAILPCGPLPAHPAELLDSQALIDVLNQAALEYDQVIIDSPPVVSVTDARIIAASCDATVLVLRAHRSKRRVTAHAVEVLSAVGGMLIGAIVNDAARGERGYRYYAARDGGRYGYGYGYGAENGKSANGAGRIKEIVGETVADGYVS